MRSKILLGVSTLALGYGASANAQVAAPERQDITEVVITAEHHTTSVQKTALSVTVINGDELADHGSTTVSQVLANVPGVQVQGVEGGASSNGGITGGGGPPIVSLRGLGTDGPNKSAAAVFYTDGVLWQGGGGEFFDVNRVEVLRGPQGTLYGRGATGGAINVITNDPIQKFEADGRIQYGSDNLVGVQAILNAPISDSLAVRFGINDAKHNGYLSNGQNDQDDLNARLKVLYKPNKDLSLLVGATYYRSNSNGAGQVAPLTASAPDPTGWITSRPAGGASAEINYNKVYATLDWNLGPMLLTYIPAYQTSDSFSTQYGGPVAATGGKISSTHPYDRTQTHELRFSSPQGAALTWDAGFYYYDNTYRTEFRNAATAAALPTANPSLQIPSQTSKAVYGEATYAISPTLHGTVGVRETQDDIKTITSTRGGPLVSFSTDTSHFDWKARLDSNLSKDTLVYGMVSTGYRPGGFINGQAYQNEVVTAYEIGSKSRLNQTFTVNAAGFYYDYSGFQSPQSGFVGVFPNGTVQTVILSAPATIYGLDLELKAQLTPNDRLTLSPELLQGHYTSDIVGTIPGTSAPKTFATNGRSLAHIPKFSVSGSYAHSFDMASGAVVTGDVDVHYQSASLTDFDVSNYPATNPYFNQSGWAEVNASLAYVAPNGKYTVSLYGKNLTDKIHKLQVNDDFGTKVAYVNAPRTFGVILSSHF